MKGGLGRRPYGVYMGSPTEREARRLKTQSDTRRPVLAGGQVVYNWEARRCGRPIRRINIDMEGGQGRRPHCVYKGSPTEREARCLKHIRMHGGRSMPEAVLYTTGKPGNAGGPLKGST